MKDKYAIKKGAEIIQYLQAGGDKPEFPWQWEVEILECVRIYLAMDRIIHPNTVLKMTDNNGG